MGWESQMVFRPKPNTTQPPTEVRSFVWGGAALPIGRHVATRSFDLMVTWMPIEELRIM